MCHPEIFLWRSSLFLLETNQSLKSFYPTLPILHILASFTSFCGLSKSLRVRCNVIRKIHRFLVRFWRLLCNQCTIEMNLYSLKQNKNDGIHIIFAEIWELLKSTFALTWNVQDFLGLQHFLSNDNDNWHIPSNVTAKVRGSNKRFVELF